jgi:HEAT repeat protein
VADHLPVPEDVTAAPRILLAQLRDLVGEARAVDICVELLTGAAAADFRAELWYFGAQATPGVLDGSWAPYWTRVWGARGLLYVWSPAAAPVVISGLADPAWRVAEMCLKVSSLRELAEAGDSSVGLTEHELPRVRANAVRTLGLVGDTEHVEAVVAALADEEPSVRRAADLAMRRLTARLDLPPGGRR